MKILYIVNMDENNKKGLFMATHEKIKAIMKNHPENEYKVISVQFKDTGIFRIAKKLAGKHTYDKSSDGFELDGIKYKKVYLSIDMKSKKAEKLENDKDRFVEFFDACKSDIEECDMVSCHWGYPHGRIAYWINKEFKKPYIVTYHGSDVHTMPFENEHIKTKVLQIMKNAKQNIFVSKKLMDTARELGDTGDNCTASRNGVNTKNFYIISNTEKNSIKEKYNISGKNVGFVGAINKIKRADKFAEIFDKIKQLDSNNEYTFTVVGDGPLRAHVEKECKEKGLKAVFTGNQDVDMVRNLMNTMDVMIIPSRREGFGCVITEANACGVSVVGSDAGGIPEAIGIDENIVADGEDFETRIAKRVVEVANSENDRESISKNTLENFSWNKIAEDEASFYREGGYEING